MKWLFMVLIIFFASVKVLSQTKIYKTNKGEIYSQSQRDSIANLGFPIGISSFTNSGDTTFYMFEIYPKDFGVSEFIKRFEGKSIPNKLVEYLITKNLKIEGKIIMVNFWSTTCGPCIAEIPQLNDLQSKFKDKVTFIGICPEKGRLVRRFLRKNRFNFVILSDADSLFKSLEIDGYPKNLFINKSGIIKKVSEGTPSSKKSENSPWEISVLEDYSKILFDINNSK